MLVPAEITFLVCPINLIGIVDSSRPKGSSFNHSNSSEYSSELPLYI